jgi:hypothetical protein
MYLKFANNKITVNSEELDVLTHELNCMSVFDWNPTIPKHNTATSDMWNKN